MRGKEQQHSIGAMGAEIDQLNLAKATNSLLKFAYALSGFAA